MALLMRRVREAFGVAPEDVRLAATSATIGEGQETAAALRRFVADLGGVPEDRVEIIAGEEREQDRKGAPQVRHDHLRSWPG